MNGIAQVQCLPVIGIDLWEHAYLVTYSGDKAAYLERFWEHLNWGKISQNFETYLLQGKMFPVHPDGQL